MERIRIAIIVPFANVFYSGGVTVQGRMWKEGLEELGNIAIWNKSTTSALISRLEKKGLVEKRKDEGSRLIRIYLTEEGYKKIDESTNTKECIEYMGLFKDKEEEDVVRVLSLMKELVDEIHQGKNPDFNTFINEYSQNLLK